MDDGGVRPPAPPPPPSRGSGFLGLDPKGWPGTIAVALVVAVVALGLPLVNRLVSGAEVLREGATVEVGRGASFTAEGSWSLAAQGRDAVELTKGPVTFRAEAGAPEQTLTEAFEEMADGIRERDGAQLFNDAIPVVIGDEDGEGLPGIVGSYAGPETEGRFAVFRGDGTMVKILAGGPAADIARRIDEVDTMIASLEVNPP